MPKIRGTSGNDRLAAPEGGGEVNGLAGNDLLSGGFGNDTLRGGAGDDFLLGSVGSDVLIGGAGNDRLDGSFGSDVMTGGRGADAFFFGTFGPGQLTTVTDFNGAAGDTLTVYAFSDDTFGTGPESVADGLARGLLSFTDTAAGLVIAFDDDPNDARGLIDTILLAGVTQATFSTDALFINI